MEDEPPARIRTRDYKENKCNYSLRTMDNEARGQDHRSREMPKVSVTYTQFLHPISYAYPFLEQEEQHMRQDLCQVGG